MKSSIWHSAASAPEHSSVAVRTLDASDMPRYADALSDILIDCVQGGASVSFMQDLTRTRAEAFWYGVAERVGAGATDLLIAEIDGEAIGTVQLCRAGADNQPHRADIAKMLVHRRARRRGVGAALMRAVEDRARSRGLTLLVLDTVTGGNGERLYARMGWVRPRRRRPGLRAVSGRGALRHDDILQERGLTSFRQGRLLPP